MLPATARLTRSQDFGLAIRRGRRAGRSRLVLHVLQPEAPRADCGTTPIRDSEEPARVGFVVSKAVGNAVVRHRVTRQLRHLVRQRLDRLPAGTLAVVRALPPAAPASSAELGRDLDAALRKLRLSAPADGPC